MVSSELDTKVGCISVVFDATLLSLSELGGAPNNRFSKCSVRSHRAPREKPRGSESYSFTY